MDVAILGVETAGQWLAGAAAGAGLSVALVGSDANAVLDAIDGLPAGVADRVDGTTDRASAVGGVDVVVETRTDAVDRTRERLADVESGADAETLVMAVTDHRPVTTVAVALQDPERFVGLHPIGEPGGPVEVVAADATSDRSRERAAAFVEQLGATPLPVRDSHGSVSGRLALATQAEAIRLLQSGAAEADAIDRAAVARSGRDVGPLEAADRQGLDAVADALSYLAETVGPRFEPPERLREKVAAGETGVARGRGFYVWEGDTPTRPADDE